MHSECHSYFLATSTPVHSTTVKYIPTPTVVSPEIKIVYKEGINKSHPLVHELVDDYGHNLEASIEAVRFYPNDLQGAMDHLARSKSANASSNIIVRSSASETGTDIDQKKPGMDKKYVQLWTTPNTRYLHILYVCSENINISQDSNAEGSYLSLDELGIVLGKLSEKLLGKP